MEANNLKIYVGQKIKEKRKEKGLRQDDIAAVLDLSRASVLNIEAGRHSPTLESIMKLCGLFNCTPNDLFPSVKAQRFIIEEKNIMVKKKVKRLKLLK